MSTALKEISYPHLSSCNEIVGGEPVIEGSRITVRCIAGYNQMGMNADEILTSFPHFTLSEVHSALAYYFDHQDDIDGSLENSSNEKYWKQQALKHPKQKD